MTDAIGIPGHGGAGAPRADSSGGNAKESESFGAILRRDAAAMLLCAGATLAIEVGAYVLAQRHGAPAREALLAALSAMTMWVALASAPMAAGGADNWGAALRGAIPADASLVALLVLWPLATAGDSASYLSVGSVLRTYCILASMAVFSIAAVCCGRGLTARRALALAAAILLSAAVATPFWTSGIIHALSYTRATAFVAWAIHANPFYSVAAAGESLRFFWHEWGLMYERIGTFRDYAPPPVLWYSSAMIYGVGAALLGGVGALRAARARRRKPRQD